MKSKTFILTALFFLSTISFLPGNSESAVKITEQSKKEQTISVSSEQFTYTYVHVLRTASGGFMSMTEKYSLHIIPKAIRVMSSE